jgi:Na+/phosphate symporter
LEESFSLQGCLYFFLFGFGLAGRFCSGSGRVAEPENSSTTVILCRHCGSILATVLMQTVVPRPGVIVSLVEAKVLDDINHGIYRNGFNIGTSVTSTIVSLAHT